MDAERLVVVEWLLLVRNEVFAVPGVGLFDFDLSLELTKSFFSKQESLDELVEMRQREA